MWPILNALVVSAGLGALVGVVRQWRDQVEQATKADAGGVRTYTFWALLGCSGAFAAEQTSPVVLATLMALVGAQHLIAKAKAPVAEQAGATTFAASLLTVLVGSLVFWRQPWAAVFVAALTAVLVGSKPALHRWTRGLSRPDMRAVLQFAAVTGVVLPLVPNQNFGPFHAFNPFSIWVMVVLISGLGFAGYVAIRLFSARAGILVTSFFGGLASSTDSTLAFSRYSHARPQEARHFALAVIVACTVMLPRLLVIAAAADVHFATHLASPFALMAIPGIVAAGWLGWHRQKEIRDDASPRLVNPLGLATALKFAALYATLTFSVKAAQALHWVSGLLWLSFFGGLANTDAMVLSLAHRAADDEAVRMLLLRSAVLAVIANTLLKIGIATSLGAPTVRTWACVTLGATVACGTAWLFFPIG